MAAEQLERSVLERKERDELRTIAQAMSIETNSRTKKADIIDQILAAAGVTGSGGGEAASAEPAPASGRSRTSRSRVKRDASAPASGTGGDGGGAEVDGQGTWLETDGAAPAPGATEERDLRLGSLGQPVVVDPQTASNGHGNGHSSGTGGRLVADPAAEAGAGSENGGQPARVATVAPVDGAPAPADGAQLPAGGAGGSVMSEAAGSEGAGSTGSGADVLVADAPVATGPGEAGGTGAAEGPSNGSGRPGAHQGRSGPATAGRPGHLGPTGGAEVGNRRGRRRRGRDRQGGDRELQGGGQEQQYQGELVPVRGLLDLRDEGYGFLRAEGYLPSQRDVYVSISQARRFALRKGDHIEGASRPAGSSEKFPALVRIDTVSGMSPEEARNRPRFEDLTPLFPDTKLRLERPGSPDNVTARIIDLLAPIGKGQRGLIVSPPKAGKTTIMKQIAHSIEANNPEVHLMVLLVDERPEEVTDMRRSVKGEVVASTFDRPADEHTQVAELAIERAKRLVETGTDVVIILDGITRLARAYNLAQPASGRIMSGGVDSGALYPPKKFFGAARNIEEGGSLTILATALVETGSKMDEVIFEEFKGTGNMELRLDRRLAERRLYPSIDVNASSTRHEELLFERGQLQQVWKLRRVLNALAAEGSAAAGLELLMDRIRTTKSNDEFLAEIAKGPAPPA
jgi:transcription termination factor Rho